MLNDCVNANNKKLTKYSELFKLAAELAERDVSFELKVIVLGDFKKAYLYLPAHYALGADPGDIVVQEIGTDGAGNARLEITTTLYDEVENRNIRYCVGGLNVEEVLERLLKKEAEKNAK